MIEFRHGEETVRLGPGETFRAEPRETYRDADPDALRSLVSEIESGAPWREAVQRRFRETNPWLARVVTDPSRDLFFRLHPPPAGAKVLDVGAGWGQHALPLARTHATAALEPAPERIDFIRAAAVQEGVAGRLCFLQADLFDIEFSTRFDLVACIGVLEWVPRFRPGDPRELQLRFLARLRGLLAPGGRLVVGIENRLGLKYLLGANDDHIVHPGIAVFDQALAQRKHRKATAGAPLRVFTYTRAEYRDLLSEAGFGDLSFFAALPDYKVPREIVPLAVPGALDAYFLGGHFVPEHDGSNGRPLPLQDELKSHYLSLARLGISEAFAPSYFITAAGG